MDLEIRHVRREELERFLEVLAHAFGDTPRPEVIPFVMGYLELDRTVCAYESGEMIGCSSAFTFDMTVPGGKLPIAGVTMVAVIPTHRRRGALRSMMTQLFADAGERNEPLAVLWASEESIYQRFGYGMASLQNNMTLARDRTRFRDEDAPSGRLRFVALEDAPSIVGPIYDAVRAVTPGVMSRTEGWWRHHTLRDPEHRRGGAAPLACVVWNDGTNDRGYVVYRVRESWSDEGTPNGRVTVHELVAETPQAEKELWRFVFGIDLVTEIRSWMEPQDPPLAHMLLEPRRARFMGTESLWVRVLDVPGALEGRKYRQDGALRLALSDRDFPGNDGVWEMVVSDGRARVQRGSGEPDVRLDAATLAAVYMGGFTFDVMQRAGRMEEGRAGGVARADDLFRWPRAPWCVENF